MKSKIVLILGYLLFSSGLVIGMLFSGMYLWANIESWSFWGYPESISYDSRLTADAQLGRLICPVLLTDGETSIVRQPITNISDRPIRAWGKAHISMPGRVENMIRRSRNTNLGVGEEAEFRWQVSTENTIYGRMILVRTFLRLTEFHPPARTRSCGIISANLWNLTSSQIIALASGSSLLLIAAGFYIIFRSSITSTEGSKVRLRITGAIGALTALSVIGTLFRFTEIILLGAILIPILLFSSVGYYLDKREKVKM